MKSGDCVQLKTGGAVMTLDEFLQDGLKVKCVWFDENEQLHRDVFPKDSLQLVDCP